MYHVCATEPGAHRDDHHGRCVRKFQEQIEARAQTTSFDGGSEARSDMSVWSVVEFSVENQPPAVGILFSFLFFFFFFFATAHLLLLVHADRSPGKRKKQNYETLPEGNKAKNEAAQKQKD